MLRGYKTEVLPSEQQALKIRQTLGTCRYLYNLYLTSNFEVYETLGNSFFVTAFTFDKYVNHVVKKKFPWINECGAKARKQALMNAERAFKNFMQGNANRPKLKKKRQQKVKAYFPKNAKGDWTIWRYKVQIPTIGIVKLKEKGYLPIKAKIRSGTISFKAGRYYVSVLVEVPDNCSEQPQGEGIGIDLGVKELAVMSNGVIKPNINKTPRVKQLDKKLRREQRRLSRKYECKKKRGEKTATYSANIEKTSGQDTAALSNSDEYSRRLREQNHRGDCGTKTKIHSAGRFKRQRYDEESAFIKSDSGTAIFSLPKQTYDKSETTRNRSANCGQILSEFKEMFCMRANQVGFKTQREDLQLRMRHGIGQRFECGNQLEKCAEV